MNAARACICLAAAALVLGNTACATIVRSSKADITFINAPGNLQAFDEQGGPLALEAERGQSGSGTTTFHSEIDYKTHTLTLTSGATSNKVDLNTRLAVGYVICDVLMYAIPMLVDWGTGKWNNFDDVDAGYVLAGAGAPRNAWPPSRSAQPEPEISEAKKSGGGGKTALVTPASSQQSLIQPAGPPPEHRTFVVSGGKLAVLDFKSYTDALKPEDVRYFTDVVRGGMLKALPSLQVMTRENLLVLLQATGRDAANCEGECEVDTGRRIGADVVVSGEILKVGSHFKLSLKLHETHEGRLLSTAVASGKTIDELDDSAQAAAVELISPVR